MFNLEVQNQNMLRFLILLPLFLAMGARAQDTTAQKKRGREFTFGAGGLFPSVNGLNNRLQALGYPKANSFLLFASLGMGYRFNQVIIGYDLSIGSGEKEDNETTVGAVQLNISTNALKAGRIIIAPHVGVGYQRMVYKQTISAATDNFDALMLTDRNQVELEHKSVFLDGGITLKYREVKNRRQIPFFKAGYRYGLSDEEWEVRRSNSRGGPLDRTGIFYFQLLLGMGN